MRRVGFEAFPAGLDMPVALRRLYRTSPELARRRPMDQSGTSSAGVFAGVRVEPMLADLGPIIRDWRPDLLIHDSAEMAGAIAAEVAGIAHAEHSFGVLRPLEFRGSPTEALDPGLPIGWASRTRASAASAASSTSTSARRASSGPRSPTSPTRSSRSGPSAFDDAPDAVLPAWLARLASRPLVYVTMGTEFNKKPEIFRSILDGLAGEPFDVVVTVGASGDPTLLGRAPGTTSGSSASIPQSRLLPRCAVFVSHGGSGALFGGLNAGVPMLAIPQGADQFLNAERIVETGIGRRLMPDDLAPDAVRDAVRPSSTTARYATASGRTGPRSRRCRSPEAVVPLLEAYAA